MKFFNRKKNVEKTVNTLASFEYKNFKVTTSASAFVNTLAIDKAFDILEIVFPDYVKAINEMSDDIMVITNSNLDKDSNVFKSYAAYATITNDRVNAMHSIILGDDVTLLNESEIPWAICHELIHLGQVLTGTLRIATVEGTDITRYYWNGVLHRVISDNHPESNFKINEVDLWELEADMLTMPPRLVRKLKLSKILPYLKVEPEDLPTNKFTLCTHTEAM